MPPRSVTKMLLDMKSGNDEAERLLLGRYYDKLLSVARRKLGDGPRGVADEEDIALEAFHALLDGVRDDRFKRLDDRDDLWQVLLMLTARRASNHLRAERTQKRGGGKVRGPSVFLTPGDEEVGGMEQAIGDEPSPELAAQFLETLRGLWEASPETEARRVIQMKLAGRTQAEIAEALGITKSQVEKRVFQIKARCNQLV